MAKKIKQRPVSAPPVDPMLEAVGEERAFEIELDDETNEILFVHHYRRQWGDDFDADVEHGLNLDEARALIGIMLQLITVIEQKVKAELGVVEKATPLAMEKNPLKDNPTQ
jgi:hypothetical protein